MPDPDEPVLRRRDDTMMADVDKRVALLEQAQLLERGAAEARWKSLEHGLDALTVEVRSTNRELQRVIAEPAASPAGRALEGDLAELKAGDIAELKAANARNEAHIAEFDDFKAEIRGAMKILRAIVTASAAISGFAAIAQIVHLTGHP